MLGIVALGALGVTLNGYVKVPWRDAAGTPKPNQSARLGYLRPGDLPNAIALLPPPPAPGSDAMVRDEQARASVLPLEGTPRYRLAVADAVRTQQNTLDVFQCAFGTTITPKATPKLAELLSRVRLDVRATSYPAKAHFRRLRPFVANNTHSCYRDDEAMPGQLTAYDSGGLEILALRREAREKLGDRFDVKTFNRAVLSEGVVPLTELRRHVASWLSARSRAL